MSKASELGASVGTPFFLPTYQEHHVEVRSHVSIKMETVTYVYACFNGSVSFSNKGISYVSSIGNIINAEWIISSNM
jgi:hypothetical protein